MVVCEDVSGRTVRWISVAWPNELDQSMDELVRVIEA